ncbi:MAG: ice-binding family protein, partial [Opitutales bacterium]
MTGIALCDTFLAKDSIVRFVRIRFAIAVALKGGGRENTEKMKNFHLALTNSIIAASAAIVFTAAPVSAAILGDAAGYAALGGSTVTFAATNNNVTGNVGVSPGTSITGDESIHWGTASGIDTGNAAAAHASLASAIEYLESLTVTNTDFPTGVLTGTLDPGVYDLGTTASWAGNIILDAGGSNDAVFVFMASTTLTSSDGSTVTIENGDASVYWVLGTSVTLGGSSSIVG